jgi:hypothetical protein
MQAGAWHAYTGVTNNEDEPASKFLLVWSLIDKCVDFLLASLVTTRNNLNKSALHYRDKSQN